MKDLDHYQLIDISPQINESLKVFPGDQPFSLSWGLSWEEDHHLAVSSITSTVHIGAHADAPFHYHPKGKKIDERELSYYLGKAQVIEIDQKEITQEIVAQKDILAPRVLFKTQSFDPFTWNDDFSYIKPEAIHFLAKKGVKTIGIDTPSVDFAQSKDLEAHQAIYQHDMAILEGLVLSKVDEGLYQLVALPLKLEGLDASPVRAILLKL